jgi:hypothetical protein
LTYQNIKLKPKIYDVRKWTKNSPKLEAVYLPQTSDFCNSNREILKKGNDIYNMRQEKNSQLRHISKAN